MKLENVINLVDYKNVPNRIHLVTGLEMPHDGSLEVDFKDLSEFTWSEECVSFTDIVYERANKT